MEEGIRSFACTFGRMNVLSPGLILVVIMVYFVGLITISWLTSRGSNTREFFTANRQSPWMLVAFGMIGATLSGVTFISTPGTVGAGKANMNFSYMQMVFGYLVGYYVIATVLMPLYYRMNLTTIYGYFRERFGTVSYRTGAGFFLLSRIIGASFRLFLVAIVLQNFVLGPFGIPLWMTVALTILLIWIYTFQGGIKTIVWTDTLQTTCLLASVMLTILAIGQSMDLNLGEMWAAMGDAGYTEMWYFEGGWGDPNNFFKQFIGGALLAIVMTGMDQDMMQKNLTCKSLSDAQKNMFTFSIILVFANVLFLSLGAMLYIYAGQIGMAVPERPDLLFPQIALTELGPFVGLTFIVGLIAAAYSSADSALTALTTSFCVDFLDFETTKRSEATKKKLRIQVHIVFSIVLFFVIILFDSLNNDSILNQLFRAAGYTYGPILGLFSFGMLTSRLVLDRYALAVCLIAPVLSFMVDKYSAQLFGGFSFGFMILALNGLLTFCGLWLISSRPSTQVTNQ